MINQERNQTSLTAGDLIAEHTRCGLPGRRRRIPTTTTTSAQNNRSVAHATDVVSASSPARTATVLRRWSVAELIAGATARSIESISTSADPLQRETDGPRAASPSSRGGDASALALRTGRSQLQAS